MKKSIRLFVSGAIQPVFFNRFVKENADKLGVNGFVRRLEDGTMEIFLEGNMSSVDQMIPICKRGPQHSLIRRIEEQEEKFQDFTDFKVLNF